MVDLDKHIPAPIIDRQPHTGRPSKYPFSRMEIGDSFWMEGGAGSRAFDALRQWKRRNPGFDYRSQVEGSGIRMWRTC